MNSELSGRTFKRPRLSVKAKTTKNKRRTQGK